MHQFFAEYKTIIIFLHVLSAVVWIGGMIAMRYAAHPSFMQIESPLERFQRIADALKKLFCIVAPFVIILLVTAIIMVIGYEISSTQLAVFGYAKEGIWTIMFLNLAVMILRRNKAQKFLDAGDAEAAKPILSFIGKYMVPLNIILGILAIFLGTTLSNSF